jgi:oligopeptide transport system substrate-binding protein
VGPLPTVVRVAAIVLATAVLATACSPGGDGAAGDAPSARPSTSPSAAAGIADGERTGGSFRFALGSDPEAIDPRFVADNEGRAVADALFDSLVALDDDLQVVPAAADSWDINEDATEFTFHLVEDATFHDGTPVRARDFVRAFDRIADGTAEPTSFIAYQLAPVVGFEESQVSGADLAGVEAIDDSTLVVRLQFPFAEFIEVLADPTLAPVPPAAEDAAASDFADRPIGNGPFAMAEPWQHNQFIRVSRFDDYAGEPALLDEVIFQIYADDPGQQAQYADLEAGQLHFAEVPVTKLPTAVEEFGISRDGYTGPGVLDGLSTTIYYYGFNTAQPPFDDPDVRRAVSLLIDRERIVEDVTRDAREVADRIVPPSVPGSQDDVCDACRFDPDRAAELIGDRDLGTIRILHNTGRTHEAIAEMLGQAIEQHLGAEVELVAQDLQPFVQSLRAGEMDIFRLGWEADYPSPGAYLFPLFSSSRIGQDNLTRYSVPEIDELLLQARAETDPEVRRDLYQQVERRVLDDVALAPVMIYEHTRVVAPEVRDFVLTAMGTVDLTRVWFEDQL